MQDEAPFSEILSAAADEPGLRKGERTRLRLMAATAGLLQETFFHNLRIVDVCRQAGVSQGTFYLYFKDKMDVATATLSKFAHHVFELMRVAGRGQPDLPAAVHATTLVYVRQFHLNRGLLRCLMQMTEESAQFEEIYRSLNGTWNLRTAEAIARRQGTTGGATPEQIMTVYAMGGMVDEFLANLYVRNDPALVERAGSPEEVAGLLSRLWIRAVL